MMDAHIPVFILSLTAIIGVSIVSLTMLSAWRDWIALKQMALKAGEDIGAPSPAARIELAALKERVRKLEAIASGVDLLP
jgi:hypothetical protein